MPKKAKGIWAYTLFLGATFSHIDSAAYVSHQVNTLYIYDKKSHSRPSAIDHKRRIMRYITAITIIITFISIKIYSQQDTVGVNSFKKYNQVSMGLSYAHFTGDVAAFTKQGGALDMCFASGRGNHIYGFNLNFLLSNSAQEFSIPLGYEHYDNPATVFFGLFYGTVLGNQHESHYQAIFGLNYGWLIHRKREGDVGGYHGVAPQIEISRSIRVGKTKYSVMQYTSQLTSPRYDPSVSNRFIDIFVNYKFLFLNNAEGRGGVFTVGVKYKLNKYSISKNQAI